MNERVNVASNEPVLGGRTTDSFSWMVHEEEHAICPVTWLHQV